MNATALALRSKNRGAILEAQVRSRALQKTGVGSVRGLGKTEATFYVPSAMTPSVAGTVLTDAVNALLTAYNASGVPSEHSVSPEALAVQKAWNLDPVVIAAGASAHLDEDAGYGPNTHDAVAAVNGGSAPDVNTGPAGATTTTTVVVNKPTTTTAAASDWTRPLLIGAGLVAVAGVATAAAIHASRQKNQRRTSAHTRTTLHHHHAHA
jgi:hypothetical protein